ncbi:division/cell wall cluster transcriptional repressor MraZ [Thioclava sp. FR2]|uniref:division/cell wall cluster transcriptional repressor MraZ n=1 Tax=Thioclava sp. FR2 TaxID=3445780 RepID=UPI003EBE4FD6
MEGTGASSGKMAEAFRGEYYQKVDSKARVLIPAAFRRVLDAGDTRTPESPRTRMVIVYGGKHRAFCECYSFAEAEQLAAQVAQLPPGSKARLKAERDLITLSATTEVDDDGRIVLPPKVREKLGITPEMLKDGIDSALAGATNRFTLWRRDVYEELFLDAIDDEDDDDTDPLALLGQAVPGV